MKDFKKSSAIVGFIPVLKNGVFSSILDNLHVRK